MNFQKLFKKHSKKFVALFFIFIGLAFILRPYFQVEKVIVLPSENTNTTKGWKTYKNNMYHFSFKYPEYLLSNFQVNMNSKASHSLKEVSKLGKNNNKARHNKNANNYNVIFEADAVKSEKSLKEFIDKNLPETKGLNIEKIKFENNPGIRITNIKTKSDAFFQYNLFKDGNFIYNFALISDESILIGGNTPLLEGIISTVKFE